MTRRIKVIHLVEDLKVGGQEKVIATIATFLNPEKYDVEVWCLARSGDVAEWLRHSGVVVKTLNLTSYHHPLNVARLAWRLRRSCADLLHTHGSFAGTFGRLAAILVGMRGIVAHVHTTDFGLRRRHVLIQRVLARFTRRIVCISEAVRHFVESVEHTPTAKTCVIYNGVHGFREVDRETVFSRLTWGFGTEDCVLSSVGALVANKGHHVLIDAMRMLVCEHPALRLLIVGDGPLRSELEDKVRRFNLSENVKFSGIVEDVHPGLDLADIFVLPTQYREGLSLAILEAMQHGLPVISTWIGGIPEAVEHNRSGLLVRPGDARALKDAIVNLVADAPLRRSMGEAGKKRFEERFTAARMISQIDALYTSITAVR
jgi:glycosyltransferase involved in cell wall biosynthesis